MERHPDRDLAHRQALRRRRNRLAIKRDRGHDVALARRERLQKLPRITQRMRVFGFRRGQELLEILKRLDLPPAATAQRVYNFVARDRIHPWRERLLGVPGVALEVDRQQGLLHCILDVRVPNPRARKSAARHSPHRPTSSRRRRYAPSSPAIEAVIIRAQGSSSGPLTGWALIQASFRLVCRYRSGEIFCSKHELTPM